MLVVEVKMNAAMGLPGQIDNGQPFTLTDIEHGKIPGQNIHIQTGRLLDLGV